MLSYIARRLLMMVPLMFGITIISFVVIHLAPGGPVEVQIEMQMKASAEARENLKRLYGLDKPLHEQYIDWLRRLGTLDFGKSFVDGRDVLDKIIERVPVTLGINVLTILVVFSIAVPIGILSAVRHHSLFDKVATVFVFVGFSTPTFWLALLLMILFGVSLGILPISGIQSIDIADMNTFERIVDVMKHLILPVGVSAFAGVAGMSRYSRSSMLEVIRQDYIRTARAKGLSEGKVIMKHAFRNALMPIVTILGLMVPALIGGSVIFETIFAIPGMGQLDHLRHPGDGTALLFLSHVQGLPHHHGRSRHRGDTDASRQHACRYRLCLHRPENPGTG
jgi:peptide/nickel transport system permease protein